MHHSIIFIGAPKQTVPKQGLTELEDKQSLDQVRPIVGESPTQMENAVWASPQPKSSAEDLAKGNEITPGLLSDGGSAVEARRGRKQPTDPKKLEMDNRDGSSAEDGPVPNWL